MPIINLTQHDTTPEQRAHGVIDPPAVDKKRLATLLTFDEKPSFTEITRRAELIANIAVSTSVFLTGDEMYSAMIGGAPYLMSALEQALYNVGITPVYAFSKRVSVEETQPDGTVVKRNIFKHEGFVEVY